MSLLIDSCNVMRGHKSGVETRIRDKEAPHLVNIDGESCHHNYAQCFQRLCVPFDNYLENMFNGILKDLKYSQDLVDVMKEMLQILDVCYIMLERFLSRRWLSAFEITLSTLSMLCSTGPFSERKTRKCKRNVLMKF